MNNSEKKDVLIEIQEQAKQMISVVDGLTAIALQQCKAAGAEAACFSNSDVERSIETLSKLAGTFGDKIYEQSEKLYSEL